MPSANGVINNIWTKTVTTKFGEKDVTLFSLEGDGESYNLGFGKQSVEVGDEVTFNTNGTKYGEVQVDKNTVKVQSRGNSVSDQPAPAKPEPKPAAKGGANRGTFPLDFQDGQRSILRQHAFTQASELYRAAYDTTEGHDLDPADLDEHVARIIRLAYQIEKYTSGDDLREEMSDD